MFNNLPSNSQTPAPFVSKHGIMGRLKDSGRLTVKLYREGRHELWKPWSVRCRSSRLFDFVGFLLLWPYQLYSWHTCVCICLQCSLVTGRWVARRFFNSAFGFRSLWCSSFACFTTMSTHPGKMPESLKRDDPKDNYRLKCMETKKNGETRVCKFCEMPKPDRCHHCRFCKLCILKNGPPLFLHSLLHRLLQLQVLCSLHHLWSTAMPVYALDNGMVRCELHEWHWPTDCQDMDVCWRSSVAHFEPLLDFLQHLSCVSHPKRPHNNWILWEKKYDELGASMTRDPGATSHPSLVKCQFCGSFHGGGHMVMACRLRGRAAAKCRARQGCWIQRAASLLRRSQWRQCNEVVVGERARCFALNLAQGPVIAVWAKEQNMGGFNFADRSISFQQQLTALYISVIIPNSSGHCPTWSAVKTQKHRWSVYSPATPVHQAMDLMSQRFFWITVQYNIIMPVSFNSCKQRVYDDSLEHDWLTDHLQWSGSHLETTWFLEQKVNFNFKELP